MALTCFRQYHNFWLVVHPSVHLCASHGLCYNSSRVTSDVREGQHEAGHDEQERHIHRLPGSVELVPFSDLRDIFCYPQESSFSNSMRFYYRASRMTPDQ